MNKSTIITVLAFILGAIVLTIGFILLTENDISNALFPDQTEPTNTQPQNPGSSTTNPGASSTPKPDRPVHPAMDLMKEDLSQYVTIDQYKDLSIKFEVEQSYYDGALEYVQEGDNLKSLLIANGIYEKVTSGVIAEKQTFSFDYCGKLNGVAFEGGTAQGTFGYIEGTTLHIVGGSTLIDGFAQQMLGAEIGSEFDIDIKFPDNYGEASLAGKDTVFTIKINHAVGEIDFKNEWINQFSEGKYPTTQSFLDYCAKYVIEYSNWQYLQQYIQQHILASANVISIPQQQFEFYYYDLRYTIEDCAAEREMSYEEFLKSGYASYLFGISAQTDEEVRKYVEEVVKTELVFMAIAKAEGYSVSEQEYNDYIELMKAQHGVTEEEIYEFYTKETITQELLIGKVNELLSEKNKLDIQIVPDEEESN